jgi:tRNA(Ile)-lysidine synthase
MRPESSRDGLTLLRPLLLVPRAQINAYVAGDKITFREDATNAEQFATRNKLRLSVIPAIQDAMGASFEAAILRSSEILSEENEWMDSLLPPFAEKLSTRELIAMHAALRRRVVLRWLKSLGIPESGFQETVRVLSLLNDGSGPAKVSLPGNWQARRRSGEIFLEKAS